METDNQEPIQGIVVHETALVPLRTGSLLAQADQFMIDARPFVEESKGMVASAESLEVNSQAAVDMADAMQNQLKAEIDEWENPKTGRRLAITRVIDGLKTFFIDQIREGVDSRKKAIAIYQQNISAHQRSVREAAAKAQREAERLLAAEQAKKEEDAQKEEERAAKLKSEKGKQAALARAEEIRQEAALMPTSVAPSGAKVVLGSSSQAETWEGSIPLCDACLKLQAAKGGDNRECPHNKLLAIQFILARPEEIGAVTISQKWLNDLARKHKDNLEIPGFKFERKDQFRKKRGSY